MGVMWGGAALQEKESLVTHPAFCELYPRPQHAVVEGEAFRLSEEVRFVDESGVDVYMRDYSRTHAFWYIKSNRHAEVGVQQIAPFIKAVDVCLDPFILG